MTRQDARAHHQAIATITHLADHIKLQDGPTQPLGLSADPAARLTRQDVTAHSHDATLLPTRSSSPTDITEFYDPM